jgi:lipoprotein-anchoring transpeptidase ErfK/SrfK
LVVRLRKTVGCRFNRTFKTLSVHLKPKMGSKMHKLATQPTNRNRRFARLGTIALSALTVGVLLATATPVGAATKKKAASSSAGRVPTAQTLANPCPSVKSTQVAAMKTGKFGDFIKVWENPDDTVQPRWTLAVGAESQNRLVFTVIAEKDGWLQTNVPVRPNGSIGWIKASEVKTYANPFYMTIELNKRLLTVCNAGKPVQRERIAIGKRGTETPKGTFYTVDLIRPKGGPGGDYGPYAFGLSGFSETIFKFGAGGDGRVGIHGTKAPKLLGSAVSSGCIRVSNAGITKISKTIFLGTPVRITD